MTQALILKEWLKTRRALLILLAVTVAFTLYLILGIQHTVTTQGVGHIWSFMLLKDVRYIDTLKYYPLLCGIVVGLAQMLPEMQQRRLKLTLHLPYSQNTMLALMLAYGLVVLSLIFALQVSAIAGYFSTLIASEMTVRVVLTTIPWYLCGLNAYMFTSAVCLEGGWRRRVLVGLTGFALTAMFFMNDASESYNSMLLLLLVFVLAASLLSYTSIYRFKEGRQD